MYCSLGSVVALLTVVKVSLVFGRAAVDSGAVAVAVDVDSAMGMRGDDVVRGGRPELVSAPSPDVCFTSSHTYLKSWPTFSSRQLTAWARDTGT